MPASVRRNRLNSNLLPLCNAVTGRSSFSLLHSVAVGSEAVKIQKSIKSIICHIYSRAVVLLPWLLKMLLKLSELSILLVHMYIIECFRVHYVDEQATNLILKIYIMRSNISCP